jgi:hypothetical protein
MTYRPAGDERSVVPARTGVTKERIWLAELGRYLRHSPSVIRKFAKREGLLKKAHGHTISNLYYVSPYGAQRIIAYIRALQGDAYLHGHQHHEKAQKRRELDAAARLRKQLPIAFPVAATEDKRLAKGATS